MQSRRKCFIEICEILEKIDIFYFIQGGVLLGAYRENDFIKWDWDVEISLFAEEFFNKFDLIKKELVLNGYKIIKESKVLKNIKLELAKEQPYEITGYTLMGWNHDKKRKEYYRWKINIPEKYFYNIGQINFLNKKVNCPTPIEDYLVYQYGDWKTPLKTDDKNIYLSKSFYKSDTFLKKIINMFKKY